jgi:creatinine amidohydrolase
LLLDELTTPEFEAVLARTRSVFIPVGSVEQHGPHLPLETDTRIARELCRLAGEKCDALVAPALPFGLCRSTSTHPGTLSISQETVKAVVFEVCMSLAGWGLRNFVIFSGHAGGTHMAALVDAGERLIRQPGLKVAVLSVLDLLGADAGGLLETPGDAHAGEAETSAMLSIAPELVKGSAAAEWPSFPSPILVRDKRRYWPGGVWGDPGKAGAEKGRKLMEFGAARLADLMRRLENFEEGAS